MLKIKHGAFFVTVLYFFSCSQKLLIKGLIPVVHELLDTDIGQGVLYHLLNYLIGNGCDMSACTSGISYVLRTSDRG